MFNTKEKVERRLGTKLFLKGYRCNSPKCVTARRPSRPGLHGQARHTLSEFGTLLNEKQKIRATYGLRETQMRRLFESAAKNPGITGVLMLQLLERRLDNVVFRLGFAASRSVARQLISHGHIKVNGRKVTIPSFLVKIKDVISIRSESSQHPVLKDLKEQLKKYEPPAWLTLGKEKLEGSMNGVPKDVEAPFDVNMVVDYYSK